MLIFPIGTVTVASSLGKIATVFYPFFEPNKSCKSAPITNNLVTRYGNQTILTRKKSDPILTIEYAYESIFSSEYRQIEHFVDTVSEGDLNSFYVVDVDRMQTHNGITGSGANLFINIGNTRYYSTQANYKAHYVFVWNGSKFKIGDVVGLTKNASIKAHMDYGTLATTTANTQGVICPMYEVYIVGNSLSDFNVEGFIPEDINEVVDATLCSRSIGGYTYSGKLSFVSKYKV